MRSLLGIIPSIKALLYDRIKSPFFATFIFVSLYYYWPVMFFVFDNSKNADKKIEAIQRIFSSDLYPSVYCLVLFTVSVIVVFSALSVLSFLIKEFADGINKKIRNNLNPDYVNSKTYTEAISALNSHADILTKANSLKDARIEMITQLVNLTDHEKKLLIVANDKGGKLSISGLTEDEKKLAEEMLKKNIFSQGSQVYLLGNTDLRAFVSSHLDKKFSE
jgi:hypothetical protein